MRSRNIYHYQSKNLLLSGLFLTSLIGLLLTSCGSVSDSQDIDNNKDNISIASALYFYKTVPDGFYREEFQGDLFYSVSHINNTSILPLVDRNGLPVYELSSDDFVEALSWSDKAAEYQQSYKELADISETSLYYQFTRFDPASPQFINIHRVFKASVLDRAGVDRSNDDAYKGRITLPGITAANVKLIVEYLWTFTTSNNYLNAVLDSYTTETDDEFIHVLKQAKLDLSYGESCDAITVYDIQYHVSKSTGIIWKQKVLENEFTAKNFGSFLEICQ